MTARYCRDCYTVFPTNPRASAKPQQSETSAIWKYLPLVLLAAGAAWFIPIDTAPPSTAAAPNDPFAKTPSAAEASSSPSSTAEGSARTGQSARREPAPAGSAAGDTFGTSGSSLIGGRGCPSGPGSNSAGIACPEMPSTPGFRSRQEQEPRTSASEAAGTAAEFAIPANAGVPCPTGETCQVVVRFSSGETATYVTRGRGSSRTLVPASGRAASLLKKHHKATIEVKTADGQVRTISVTKAASGARR